MRTPISRVRCDTTYEITPYTPTDPRKSATAAAMPLLDAPVYAWNAVLAGPIAYVAFDDGVRVLDLSGLADFEGSPLEVGLGDGVGIREVGNYVLEDSDTWSFKTNRIAADGSFYGYGNDLVRGFDVYRFDGAGLSVPPLEPVDLASKRPPGRTKGMAASAALVGPAMLFALVARRRTRRQA